MRAPKFCSECGEKISVKGRGRWPAPTYCMICAPRFRPARLLIFAGFFACVLLGFFWGRQTTAHQPFYLIGTPLGERPPVAQSANPQTATGSDAQSAPATDSATTLCGARTKAGRPCRRKVVGGGYCFQHRDQLPVKRPASDASKINTP